MSRKKSWREVDNPLTPYGGIEWSFGKVSDLVCSHALHGLAEQLLNLPSYHLGLIFLCREIFELQTSFIHELSGQGVECTAYSSM